VGTYALAVVEILSLVTIHPSIHTQYKNKNKKEKIDVKQLTSA